MVNPRDIYMEGQGKGIAIKQEADLNDVQKIQPAQIPPSMIQLSESLSREIQEISGVNEELLGTADDDKSGILAQLRQGAGLTTLQVLFDQLDSSQKALGEIMQEVIQKKYMYGKIARILGEEPVEEFDSKTFLNYDIVISEGINTETQRQMAFVQTLHMRELGIPIPTKYILDLATLQDSEKLIAAIEKEEQQQAEQQQQQMQQQMAVLAAQVKDLEAKAAANYGLGVERLSRQNENAELAVERRAKAIEDISDAQLNRVKTLKELQDIDMTQIQRLIEISEYLKTFGGDAAIAENAISDDVITEKGQRVESQQVQSISDMISLVQQPNNQSSMY
jgi:hypothetical protein